MARKFVIVGAGAAGSAAARTLARLRPQDEIHLFCNEPVATYYRPGLPDMLSGRLALPHLKIADREHYARLGVVLHQEHAAELDTDRQVVKIRGGREESYDRLLLATGARPYRNPNWVGRQLEGILTLRKLEHVYSILRAVQPDLNVVVIGGGIRALQIAEALAGLSVKLLLLVRESWIGSPLFTKPQGMVLRNHAEALGIEVRTLDEVHEFLGYEGRIIGIRTKAGGMLECNLVIVALQMVADMRLALRDIEHMDGFLVDAHCRTSVSNIYAAGDAALPRASADGTRWRGWERAGREGIRAAFAMADFEALPAPAPAVVGGRIFGLHYLHLGEPPLDVNVTSVEMEKNEHGMAYLWREQGMIAKASLLGFRHCHHAMARAYAAGCDVDFPIATLVDPDFDWRRVSALPVETRR